MTWIWIAGGGAFGALLRGALLRLADRTEPALATLAANLVACGLLGGVTANAGRDASEGGGLAPALVLFLTIGLCGSLSTFSTLCADLIRLRRSGSRRGWIGVWLAHLLGGPLAFALGSLLGS